MPRINIEDYGNGCSRVTVDLETYNHNTGFTSDIPNARGYDYIGQAITQEHFQALIDRLRGMDTARSVVGVPYEINKMPEGWPWVLNRTGRNPRESKKEFTGDIEFDIYV